MRRHHVERKIISFFLAFVMLVSCLPIAGVEAQVTDSDSGAKETVTDEPDTEFGSVTVTLDGQPVSVVEMPGNEKIILTASGSTAESYQWQIYASSAEMWVNIYDKTENACEVSFALVSSMLDEFDTVRLRCVATVEGVEQYSSPVTVAVVEDTEPELLAAYAEPEETDGYVVESETIVEPLSASEPETIVEEEPESEPEGIVGEEPESEEEGTVEEEPESEEEETVGEEPVSEPEGIVEEEPVSEEEENVGEEPVSEPEETVGTEPVTEAEDTAIGEEPEIVSEPEEFSASEEAVSEDESAVVSTFALEQKMDAPVLFAGEGELTTHTITIKYLYDNEGPDMTGSVANDYIATLATGTGYSATVSSPVRTGYKAYVAEISDWKENEKHWFEVDADGNYVETGLRDGTTYTISVASIEEDLTYYIVYLPQNTTFQVSSYLQNIYDDFYTFGGSETHEATVGSSVLFLNIAKKEGFTTLQYDDARVAADGSTILDIYYDRQYHLVNFQLDGGYGVEPVYARYQTDFKISTPTRAGYTFDGWEVTSVTYEGTDASDTGMGSTAYGDGAYTGWKYVEIANDLAGKLAAGDLVEMPPFDITFTAKWVQNTVNYTVIYWKQNANDDGYSFWGEVTKTATSGSIVNFDASETSADRIENQPFAQTVVQEALESTTEDWGRYSYSAIPERKEYEYFHFNNVKTEKDVLVNGDGSTVLNVYYDRNEYTLKFYFARSASISSLAKYRHSTTAAASLDMAGGESKVYVIQNQRADQNNVGSILTNTKSNTGLLLDGDVNDEYVSGLKITKITNDTYYVQDYEGKYLTISGSSASFTSTPTELQITEHSTGKWIIGRSGQYLCQFGSVTSTYVAGYNVRWDPGNFVSFYEATGEPQVTQTQRVQISTATESAKLDAGWNAEIGFPTLLSAYQDKICSEEVGGYTYYYIPLTAKYGANISALWPSSLISEADSDYKVLNWGPLDGCGYRTENRGNASIGGIYDTMSAEILGDPTISIHGLVGWWNNGEKDQDQTYHIYYSILPGETADITVDGVGYKKVQDITFLLTYNGYSRLDPIQFYGVEYQSDTVVKTDYDGSSNAPSSWDRYVAGTNREHDFYYKRNKYKLQFFNYDKLLDEDGHAQDLSYGQPIQSYEITAEHMEEYHYPESLEPGVYQFAGWYLSPTGDGEVDWENSTMDDADLTVYAKWEKVTHTVTFYETYNDLQSDKPIADDAEFGEVSYPNSQQVYHGDPVTYHSTISREGYNFVGWFYLDEETGEPVAFLPNNMPVNQDLKIYAEWQSDTMIKYTIHYVLIGATRAVDGEYLFADGHKYNLNYETKTQIADDTTGQLQDGRTKTFYAKALPQLWAADDPNNPTGVDYCHNHYPMLSSHAIMFSPDQDPTDDALQVVNVVRDSGGNVVSYELDYTFYYVKPDKVNYTVRYINKDTGTNVFKDFAADPTGEIPQTVMEDTKSTMEAVTTERMKMIQGYVPDEYQKRVVLTAFPRPGTDDNIITFYYTEDPSPMYYVEHLIENADGTWTTMAKEFSTGDEGDTITRTKNTYAGHEFKAEQAWVNTSGEYILPEEGENWVGEETTITVGDKTTNVFKGTYSDGTAKGILKKESILVIRFYYTLKEYNYVIEHRILGKDSSDNWLFGNEADSTETGTAKYGSIITGDASDNNSYRQWKSLAYAQGYWVEGSIEDPSLLIKNLMITDDSTKNVITFWYVDAPVEIEYRAVVDGVVSDQNLNGCYVSPTLDSTSSHAELEIHGSVPTSGPGYRFVGWYKNEECTVEVDSAWVSSSDLKLTPKPVAESEDALPVLRAATYYAKFEPIELTIEKKKAEGTIISDTDTFLFRIQGTDTATAGVDLTVSVTGIGSTTVRYLPAGEYTITELTNWSWRYEVDGAGEGIESQTYTVTADGPNTVTFTNKRRSDIFWLGGESSVINKFNAVSPGSGS